MSNTTHDHLLSCAGGRAVVFLGMEHPPCVCSFLCWAEFFEGTQLKTQSAFVQCVFLGLILLFQEGKCVPLTGYSSQPTNDPSSPHCSLRVADWLAFSFGITIFFIYVTIFLCRECSGGLVSILLFLADIKVSIHASC